MLLRSRRRVQTLGLTRGEIVIPKGAYSIPGLIEVICQLLRTSRIAACGLDRLTDLPVEKPTLAMQQIREDRLTGERVPERVPLLVIFCRLLDRQLGVDRATEVANEIRLGDSRRGPQDLKLKPLAHDRRGLQHAEALGVER